MITTYKTAMNGTMTVETIAMRLRPPMTTSAVATVTIRPEMTTAHEYVVSMPSQESTATPVVGSFGAKFGSKKRSVAEVMP